MVYWRTALAALLAIALVSASKAEDDKKEKDDKKKDSTPSSVKSTGKIVIIGADGKVTERILGGEGDVKGFSFGFKEGEDAKGTKFSAGKLTVIFPDGTKKEFDLAKPEGDKSGKSPEGDKSPKPVPKSILGADRRPFLLNPGAGGLRMQGLDEQIRKKVEEALQNAFKEGKAGKVDPEVIQKALKSVQGIGPAVEVELGGLKGKSSSIEKSLEQILQRLEKLEKAISDMKKK